MLSGLATLLSRRCRPRFFDASWYLETYDDVAAAGMDPLRHYLRYGRAEGRLPCFMVAATRERDLRWGLAETGEVALSRLASGAVTDVSRADRVWAALACARAAARRGDWAAADTWLRGLDPGDLLHGFCLPDPSLLVIETALRTGDLARAEDQLDRALRQFGATPDLMLAQANREAVALGLGPRWLSALARLYKSAGLPGIALTETAEGAPFDRLTALPQPPRRAGSQPLVSVIMPARDAEATIATALRSLTAQSWRKLEIIVVDNGSRDGTGSIVRDMARQDDRIRLCDGGQEPGTYAARNLGIEAAQGDLITVLDADDWAHPNRLEIQARALLGAGPDVVAAMSHWVRTTPDLLFTRWWREDGLVHPDISSLMIRAEARARLGYWDRVRAAADTEYIGRVRAVFGPGAIREVLPGIPLAFGRVHGRSLTQRAETDIASHLFGARRDYDLASRRWHARLQPDRELPLPRRPARRPFAVPAALALDPGDPPPEASAAEWVAGSGIYDNAWYMQTYADLRASDLDGVSHYEQIGEAEGRSPGPGFAPSAYELEYGPLTGSALQHYLTTGRAQGHAPLPVFDGALPAPGAGRHILVFGHQARSQIFGAERCLVDLLDAAVAAGVTPSVVLPQIQNRAYLDALRARSYQVHVRPYGWRFGDVPPPPQTLADLVQLIRETGAREVHQNTLVLDAPVLAARAAGVPATVHVHELPATDPRLCMGMGLTAEELRHRVLEQADRLVANSRPVLDWLDAPEDRALLVPNRIDADLLEIPFTPGPVLRVGLIGSLVAKKGVRDLVAVARGCRKAGLPLSFVLVGPRSADLAALMPLPSNTECAGYVETPGEAMGLCDIVLSLSHVAESFGRTVLEAMAAGRPVICYDRGMPPELVGADGRAGRVVPADRPDAVIAALKGILSDPSALHTLSQGARTRATAYLQETEKAAQTLFDPF